MHGPRRYIISDLASQHVQILGGLDDVLIFRCLDSSLVGVAERLPLLVPLRHVGVNGSAGRAEEDVYFSRTSVEDGNRRPDIGWRERCGVLRVHHFRRYLDFRNDVTGSRSGGRV